MGFPGIAGMLQYIKDGRLRALAVTGAKRSPELPDVPTIAEAGVKGYEATLWLGIIGPAALPKDVIARLNTAMSGLLKQPERSELIADVWHRNRISRAERIWKICASRAAEVVDGSQGDRLEG